MPQFCYECYKKIWECKQEEHELEMSKEPALCDACEQLKPVVIPKSDSLEMIVGGLLRGWDT